MRILVVEDERDLNRIICKRLAAAGYSTDACYDGREALDYLEAAVYDAAVFDVMMPRMDGFEAVRRLRERGDATPVLFLTARDAVGDRVAGLDLGANDYLVKPFSFDELLARIRAMTRRRGELIFDDTLQVGDLTLNLANYTLSRGDQRVQLANKEFEIMKQFFLHPDTILNKEELLTRLWGFENGAAGNNVEVYISFLRKKLTYLCSQMRIACIRNVGYRLEEPLCFGS